MTCPTLLLSAVAEGGAYGEDVAGGNSFSYWFLAVAFAGVAAISAATPNIVGSTAEWASICCIQAT